MLIRTFKGLIFLGVIFGLSLTLQAKELETFTPEKFEAAQANGETILLDFKASWCPTCKKQGKVLSKLANDKKYQNYRFFLADYDTYKDLRKAYKVQRQSTLILFQGKKEVARQIAEVRSDKIESFLDKALVTSNKDQTTHNAIQPYSNEALKTALNSENAVVLDFHAEWCGTCRKQEKAFYNLQNEGKLENVTILKVNFDDEKELRQIYGVRRQSTLLLFNDGMLTGRIIGETKPDKLMTFIEQG